MEERKGREGKEERKWYEAKENYRKLQFLSNFPLRGLHLAHKCRPMVYSCMPNFIVLGIYYYI